MSVTPAPVRVSRWLRLALVLSLTLNLLVVGLVAGAWIGRDRDARRDTALADIGFGPFIRALPDEDRHAIGTALVERAGPLRENRRELREQFGVLLTALRAEPFDIEPVKAAVAAQQARLTERFDIGKALIYDRIAAMTGDERRAFADRLEEGMRHGRRFHRKRHEDRPPPEG